MNRKQNSKTTKESIKNFFKRNKFRLGNTKVVNVNTQLKLYDNTIAEIDENNNLWITNGGWFTDVTMNRLNGLPGVKIENYADGWHLNGEPWDGEWIFVGKI